MKIMKFFIPIFLVITSFNVFADTVLPCQIDELNSWLEEDDALQGDDAPSAVQEADRIYSLRGADVGNAKKAAELYGQLAASITDPVSKAKRLIRQSCALYYVGNQLGDMTVMEQSEKAAKAVVEMFKNPGSDGEEALEAMGLIYHGVSLAGQAKIFKANGQVWKASGKARKAVRVMKSVIDSGYEDLYQYAAHRVIGGIRLRAPAAMPIGNKDEARDHLQTAFKETLMENAPEDVRVSVHGLNNLYYASILEHFGEKGEACEILQNFLQQDPNTLMKGRVPETQLEMKAAEAKLSELKMEAVKTKLSELEEVMKADEAMKVDEEKLTEFELEEEMKAVEAKLSELGCKVFSI